MFDKWNSKTHTLTHYPSFRIFLYSKRDDNNNILEIGFDFAWVSMAAGFNDSSREDAFKDRVQSALETFFRGIGYSGMTVKGNEEVKAFVERLVQDVPMIKDYIVEG